MVKSNDKQKQKAVPVTSLDQIATVIVNLEIEHVDGTVFTLPVKQLTYHESRAIEQSHPNPHPPMYPGSGGKKIWDREDPEYQERVMDAINRRSDLKLLAMIEGGGAIDFGDKTEDERIAEIKKLPETVLNALMGVLQEVQVMGEARIQERADTFQRNGTRNS